MKSCPRRPDAVDFDGQFQCAKRFDRVHANRTADFERRRDQNATSQRPVVSDLVRTAPDSNIWEVQFKRRVVGKLQFQIEYERRGDRSNDEESLTPLEFPDARQLSYYFAVRSGGRLELEHSELTQGWQRVDWNTVPQPLRESRNRNAPAFSLRSVGPPARAQGSGHTTFAGRCVSSSVSPKDH